MKLNKEMQVILRNAVDIATGLGIESMAIDKYSLRGENKELGIAIIMPTDDIELDFVAMGLGNLQKYKSKQTAIADADITFEEVEQGDNTFVSKLKLSSGRTSITHKCQNPNMIKAPKAINDPIHHKLDMSDVDVETIIKGISVMSADTLSFTIDTEKVLSMKTADTDGDMFAYELDTPVQFESPDAGLLAKSYKSKTLKTILTNYIRKDDNTTLPIVITRRGVMRLTVLGIDINFFPER